MKSIAKKTRFALFLYIELIAGILCFILVAVVTALLIWYGKNGAFETLDNVVVSVIILAIFYLLCVLGGGWLICRFVKWKKLPDDLMKVDGEYLYFYTDKEMKIALNDVKSVVAGSESFWVHFVGGGYGTVEIKTVGKKYKVCFVDEAMSVPVAFMDWINSLSR